MHRKNPPLLADPRYTAAPTPYSGNRHTEFDDYAPAEPVHRPGGVGRGGNMVYGNQGYEQSYDDGYGARPVGRGVPMRQQAVPQFKQEDRGGYGRGGIMQTPRMGAGGYDQGYNNPTHEQTAMSPMAMGGMAPQQGCVVMVYGLDNNKLNCDRVFNLFCLYGNVVRIYFLKTKEGTAMAQLGDKGAVERAMFNLGGVSLFEKKLIVTQSKQAFLQDVAVPHELPDGTNAFKDYMGNRNNRFSTPESAAKNRIMHPTEILHYFNAPPNITEDDLRQVFSDAGSPVPSKVLQFQSKSDKSSAGLVEFERKEDALEAIVFTNHASIPNPGGRPYVFKLCFSQSSIRRDM